VEWCEEIFFVKIMALASGGGGGGGAEKGATFVSIGGRD